jgi:hypothetical protein
VEPVVRGCGRDPGGDAGQHDGSSPDGYRFGDYWRLGLPLLEARFVLALLIVARVWPL